MGLTDFLRSQFIDIIEWTDDSRDTLSFRFPDEDKEIKNGAQLIVRESQKVQFVYLGQYGDLFGPGKYTLTTDNIPILSRLNRKLGQAYERSGRKVSLVGVSLGGALARQLALDNPGIVRSVVTLCSPVRFPVVTA